MFRIIEVVEGREYPRVVCNNGKGTDDYLDSFYLSGDNDDLEEFAMCYDNVRELLMDSQMLQNILVSTDLGIQCLAANGSWYLYDFNRQNEHVHDLVNMK